MRLRFLILNTDYPEFLRWFYAQQPGLEQQPYEEQMRARNNTLFGVADFYSSNLRTLGHEAYEIHANNEFMQKTWAREHGIGIEKSKTLGQRARSAFQSARGIGARTPLRYLKPLVRTLLRSLNSQQPWYYQILAAQVKHYRPNILLNQDIGGISSRFLKEIKPYVGLLMGQIASRLPEDEDFSDYHLVISSLPNLVEYFRKRGVPSELSRFAFEPSLLPRLEGPYQRIPVSFVGSLSPEHQTRVRLLEHLSSHLDIRVWASGLDKLPSDSPIRCRYAGSAWGIEMYKILRASKITLNHHIGIAGSYANNMRLFEATGVGAMLVSDWKENLSEMFEPGKEVVTYRSPQECAEVIVYYLKNDDERKTIARAGQQRTLRDHTYFRRMQELVGIVERHMRLVQHRT